MIVMQRVRVRWGAAARGAPAANARRGLSSPVALPADLPVGDVVVHEVLADEASGYRRTEEVTVDLAGDAWLSLDRAGPDLVVSRLPGWASFPRPGRSRKLFTLAPGEVGRYRANFRITGCVCDPHWIYEDWLVQVSNGRPAPGRLVEGAPDHDVDARVHLYGGSRRTRGMSRPARSR